MWHHVMAKGLESPGFRDGAKKVAIDEMRHAEALAERIAYLGGRPTTQATHVKVGGDLGKMIADDVEAEEEAIQMYRRMLGEVKEDPVTYDLILNILKDEEEHHDYFTSLQ